MAIELKFLKADFLEVDFLESNLVETVRIEASVAELEPYDLNSAALTIAATTKLDKDTFIEAGLDSIQTNHYFIQSLPVRYSATATELEERNSVAHLIKKARQSNDEQIVAKTPLHKVEVSFTKLD